MKKCIENCSGLFYEFKLKMDENDDSDNKRSENEEKRQEAIGNFVNFLDEHSFESVVLNFDEWPIGNHVFNQIKLLFQKVSHRSNLIIRKCLNNKITTALVISGLFFAIYLYFFYMKLKLKNKRNIFVYKSGLLRLKTILKLQLRPFNGIRSPLELLN